MQEPYSHFDRIDAIAFCSCVEAIAQLLERINIGVSALIANSPSWQLIKKFAHWALLLSSFEFHTSFNSHAIYVNRFKTLKP